NTLLDARGHVKLADFGSCARIGAEGMHEAKASVPVGTCDYIAPETLRAREAGGVTASPSCDWWSVGAVLYEMLYGDPPFYSDSVPETYAKIMASDAHLAFDDDAAKVSDAAKDLMRRLLVRREERLDAAAIKQHPFFAQVDWAAIRDSDAPFVPHIAAPDDTSNFSVGDEDAAADAPATAAARASSSRLGHGRAFAGEQLPFVGFTYAPRALATYASAQPASPSRKTEAAEDNEAAIFRLRARVAHLEAAQKDWDAERRRLVAECAALEARLAAPPPEQREASVQTDPAAPRLSGIATLSPAAVRMSPAAPRRSISSAVDDAPPTVVATLVGGSSSTDAAKPAIEHRRSLAPVSRAERRVSAGVASDALSVVGTKCDRLAARLDGQAADLAAIHTAVLSVCSALAPGDAADLASPDGSRRGRRKSEHPRRRPAFDTSQPPEPADTRALDLYKSLADDLVLALRAQLADTEQQRTAAEARAAELLAWIGRESKGRALLEDMIRTAQQACKLAEEKFDAMLRDTDLLKATVASRDEEIAAMHATVETRDKELRHLRRASRKALDQLADLKSAPPPPPPVPVAAEAKPDPAVPAMQKSIHALELELQEAAAVHVRQQFEIARLEGEVSRLESEKSLFAKDIALKDRRLRDAEAKARAAADSDGIRVRAIDPVGAGTTSAGEDDGDASAAPRFGSIG
ncbi:Serine/threonine-protein kinase MRCK gamma, partial [Coemansia sp. RSA 2052]